MENKKMKIRVSNATIILPKIEDEEIEKLYNNFYSWCQSEIDSNTLHQVEGVSYKTINRTISSEKRDLSWKTAKALADYKKTSLDHIFGLNNRPLDRQVILERYNMAMVLSLKDKSLMRILSEIRKEYDQIKRDDAANCSSHLAIPGFARRVNMVRLERNISLQALADSLGIKDLSLVSYNKLNSRGIRLKRLLGLSLSLGVSLDWLIGLISPQVIDDPILNRYILVSELPASSFEKYKKEISKILEESL